MTLIHEQEERGSSGRISPVRGSMAKPRGLGEGRVSEERTPLHATMLRFAATRLTLGDSPRPEAAKEYKKNIFDAQRILRLANSVCAPSACRPKIRCGPKDGYRQSCSLLDIAVSTLRAYQMYILHRRLHMAPVKQIVSSTALKNPYAHCTPGLNFVVRSTCTSSRLWPSLALLRSLPLGP